MSVNETQKNTLLHGTQVTTKDVQKMGNTYLQTVQEEKKEKRYQYMQIIFILHRTSLVDRIGI